MNRTRMIFAVISSLSLPALLSAQIAPGTQQPKLTPEQRAQNQADLQAKAALLFNGTITTAKKELRDDLVPLRDTLQETDGNASRLIRARTAGSVSVMLSTANVLRVQCAGAHKVADTTLVKIKSMNTRNVNGDRLLNQYRTAVTNAEHALAECDHTLGTILADKVPDPARLAATATSLDKAIQAHDLALESLMNGLEITMYPKGYVAPKAH